MSVLQNVAIVIVLLFVATVIVIDVLTSDDVTDLEDSHPLIVSSGKQGILSDLVTNVDGNGITIDYVCRESSSFCGTGCDGYRFTKVLKDELNYCEVSGGINPLKTIIDWISEERIFLGTSFIRGYIEFIIAKLLKKSGVPGLLHNNAKFVLSIDGVSHRSGFYDFRAKNRQTHNSDLMLTSDDILVDISGRKAVVEISSESQYEVVSKLELADVIYKPMEYNVQSPCAVIMRMGVYYQNNYVGFQENARQQICDSERPLSGAPLHYWKRSEIMKSKYLNEKWKELGDLRDKIQISYEIKEH